MRACIFSPQFMFHEWLEFDFNRNNIRPFGHTVIDKAKHFTLFVYFRLGLDDNWTYWKFTDMMLLFSENRLANEWINESDVNIDETRLLSYPFHRNAVKWSPSWMRFLSDCIFDFHKSMRMEFWEQLNDWHNLVFLHQQKFAGHSLRSRHCICLHSISINFPTRIFSNRQKAACVSSNTDCLCMYACIILRVCFYFVSFCFHLIVLCSHIKCWYCVLLPLLPMMMSMVVDLIRMYLFLHVVGNTNTTDSFSRQTNEWGKWWKWIKREWVRVRVRVIGWKRAQISCHIIVVFIFRFSSLIYANTCYSLSLCIISILHTYIHISWICVGLFWLYNCQQPYHKRIHTFSLSHALANSWSQQHMYFICIECVRCEQ